MAEIGTLSVVFMVTKSKIFAVATTAQQEIAIKRNFTRNIRDSLDFLEAYGIS